MADAGTGWMFNIVERGSAAYSRIRAMLAEAPVVNDGSESVPDGRGVMNVDVRKFVYPQTEHTVLENVSFTLKPGQMLGICGPTGAGKSTVLSLLQRHFDVTQGDIRFHDIPLTNLLLDDWRGRLAVVSQTPFLFSDTVANNIALGRRRQLRKRLSTSRAWPASMTIFCVCHRAMKRKWVSVALCFPAGKNSVSRLPARCC